MSSSGEIDESFTTRKRFFIGQTLRTAQFVEVVRKLEQKYAAGSAGLLLN